MGNTTLCVVHQGLYAYTDRALLFTKFETDRICMTSFDIFICRHAKYISLYFVLDYVVTSKFICNEQVILHLYSKYSQPPFCQSCGRQHVLTPTVTTMKPINSVYVSIAAVASHHQLFIFPWCAIVQPSTSVSIYCPLHITGYLKQFKTINIMFHLDIACSH